MDLKAPCQDPGVQAHYMVNRCSMAKGHQGLICSILQGHLASRSWDSTGQALQSPEMLAMLLPLLLSSRASSRS